MIRVYTDGACLGNPGPGGWAAVVIDGGEEKEFSGGEPLTTNNRMELSAAINALKNIPELSDVEIYTDSTYVKNGITSWIKNWEKNGWKNSQKEPVKNKELWLELLELSKKHKIQWQWVKGHSGDEFNERADKLARSQCK